MIRFGINYLNLFILIPNLTLELYCNNTLYFYTYENLSYFYPNWGNSVLLKKLLEFDLFSHMEL